MLRTRLLTTALLLSIVSCFTYIGGLPFLALTGLLLTLAEIEFCRLTIRTSFRSAVFFGTQVMWVLLLDAQLPALDLLRPGLTLALLTSLAWQLIHHQRSRVSDWALTVTGGLYFGLGGACFIALRSLRPDGMWWTLIVIFAILFTDGSAYLVGSSWGRHKLIPALSEGKSWEGYLAGVIFAAPTTALLTSFLHTRVGTRTRISGVNGLILALLIAVLAPLGDLAISMIKRQAGVKDSGSLFPGHGGALDRVDTVLWAAVIAHYYISWFANGR